MTANPVTAQDALDLDCRREFAAWYGGEGCKSLERSDKGHYILMQTNLSWTAWRAGWLSSRNLLAQPRIDLDALKRPLRGADIGRYDMDYSFDQGWNQCIDEIKARMGEAQPRNDAEVCADCGSEMILVCAGLEKTCRELKGGAVDAEAVRKAVEALEKFKAVQKEHSLGFIGNDNGYYECDFDMIDEALAALQSAQKEGGNE